MNRQTKIAGINRARKKVWFYNKKFAEATSEGAIEMYDGLIKMYEQHIKKLAMM
jgi:hypothetical protein